MSRIGKMPVTIPAGVEVKVDGQTVTVKGPKGELTRTFNDMMDIKVEGNEVIVERPDDSREAKSFHGLTRTLINNMVQGVSEGYSVQRSKARTLRSSLVSRIRSLSRLPRTSPSKFPARPRSSLMASAKSRLARLLQTFANGVSPNLTRARVFAMKANMYVASLVKLLSLSKDAQARKEGI